MGKMLLNFSDMISWLREDFEKEGYRISDTYEEESSLPIDLFCTKGQGEARECCVVIVASINNISNEFQKCLFFYQYYISLHYKRWQYRIVLAIPDSATVDKVPWYADKEEKGQDFYKENGFGLWKINVKGEIDRETYSPLTLEEKIYKDLERDLAKGEKKLTEKASEIIRFVDKYIHNSVYAIAGFYPIKFKKRHIDPKLLEEALKLRKFSYENLLFDSISEHLSKTDKDDFDFCTNILNKLWSKYFGDEIYPEEHRKLEPLLIELYPKYRDHYIHQFQVFLLGALFIDILMQNKKIKSQNDFFSKSWLLAASFHDFAYPIQKYDDYISHFFKQSLCIEEPLSLLELKNNYMEYSFSSHVEHILCSISKCFNDKDFKRENETNNFNKIRQFFYHEITKNKNHGLLGGLGLLKRFEDKNKIDFSCILLPAAVAIALHDDEIWQPLLGLETNNGEGEKCVTSVRELSPLDKIDFDTYPLAFLLILCDNIQDWGRHYKDEKWEKPLQEADIRLKSVFFDSGKLTIQLFFNDTRESRKLMTYKEETLGKIEKLLKSSDIQFVIEYWDREKNEPTSYKFRIGGNN